MQPRMPHLTHAGSTSSEQPEMKKKQKKFQYLCVSLYGGPLKVYGERGLVKYLGSKHTTYEITHYAS